MLQIEKNESGAVAKCRFDAALYPLEAVMRAAYWYTENNYVFLEWASPERRTLIVEITPKEASDENSVKRTAAEFANSVLDHKIRLDISKETKTVQEVIVKKAFSEALSKSEEDLARELG